MEIPLLSNLMFTNVESLIQLKKEKLQAISHVAGSLGKEKLFE
jgi:hypothetical protein